MARMQFRLMTNNEGAGFYGTAYLAGGNEAYAEKAWEIAFEQVITAVYAISEAARWPDTQIRDFLDSTCGRHYADHLTGAPERLQSELNQPKYLADACRRFSKTYDPEDF